jgi:hypothetical protein
VKQHSCDFGTGLTRSKSLPRLPWCGGGKLASERMTAERCEDASLRQIAEEILVCTWRLFMFVSNPPKS